MLEHANRCIRVQIDQDVHIACLASFSTGERAEQGDMAHTEYPRPTSCSCSLSVSMTRS